MAILKRVRPRVLIVDDDDEIRDVLREALSNFGYETLTVSNGDEAFQIYQQEEIDLVLSDLMMTPMSGMELLAKISKIDPNAIFIMITGYPSLGTAVEAVKLGACDYIAKPFRMDELQIKIERALLERSLKERIKNMKGIMWALLISIPIWLILGIILARLLT